MDAEQQPSQAEAMHARRYAVLVDGAERKGGSLFEDFEPAINPPEEIDDPDDSKPSSWVDTPKCACLPADCFLTVHYCGQRGCMHAWVGGRPNRAPRVLARASLSTEAKPLHALTPRHRGELGPPAGVLQRREAAHVLPCAGRRDTHALLSS
jgi:hypothetical protein